MPDQQTRLSAATGRTCWATCHSGRKAAHRVREVKAMKQKQITPEVHNRVPGDPEMHAELRAALRSMRDQSIPFTGPFLTAKGLIVVATGKFVLTGNELIELMERGRLNATGIEALVGALNGHNNR